MATKSELKLDIQRAKALWARYCAANDLSAQHEKTAGIDPESGRVWFGDSAADVCRRMKADGHDAPLYFVRVGYDFYTRKG